MFIKIDLDIYGKFPAAKECSAKTIDLSLAIRAYMIDIYLKT
jgi:hypothetical protein